MEGRSFEVEALDGRALRAQVVGPESGDLVVYHAGTPGTRNVCAHQIEEGAERDLRHVCCSRPGYGGSDRQAGRSVSDCAADIAAVADALSVDRFHVVGHSGGGPHALACAALLPDRVISAAVLSSFAPRDAEGLEWQKGMAVENIAEFEAVEAGDSELTAFIQKVVLTWREIKDVSTLRKALGGLYGTADHEVLMGDANARFQVACIRLITAEEIWGWFDDDCAILGNWGFGLGEIQVPVAIWHGEHDPTTPASHGAWLASRIPAKFHCLRGEGHISLFDRRYGSILDDLIEIGR